MCLFASFFWLILILFVCMFLIWRVFAFFEMNCCIVCLITTWINPDYLNIRVSYELTPTRRWTISIFGWYGDTFVWMSVAI